MSDEPTNQKTRRADTPLAKQARLAVFGDLGGARPQKDNRATSWWGGNFLGTEGEKVPVCKRSGRIMHPVLQIRVDELPEIPLDFKGLALINFWLDLHISAFRGGKNGNGFLLRTYTDIENLVPVGVGYRESSELPTLPVLWHETAREASTWDDMSGEVPAAMMNISSYDWVDDNKDTARVEQLREKYPIKLGGWPAWIQGSNWPKNAEFYFQVDATKKGSLSFGYGGSFYIFKTANTWEVRADSF